MANPLIPWAHRNCSPYDQVFPAAPGRVPTMFHCKRCHTQWVLVDGKWIVDA